MHQILKIGSFNSAGWTVRDVPDVSNFPLFVGLPADVKSRILQCTDKCNETTRPAANFMPHVNFFFDNCCYPHTSNGPLSREAQLTVVDVDGYQSLIVGRYAAGSDVVPQINLCPVL